jgi:NAD(P)-dependent dehydrogenase (short-subunit alcohol dehydrogenase family)
VRQGLADRLYPVACARGREARHQRQCGRARVCRYRNDHSLDDGQRDKIARRSALHRLAEVDDVANAVEFLMGDKAGNITGTVLTVDAGSTA